MNRHPRRTLLASLLAASLALPLAAAAQSTADNSAAPERTMSHGLTQVDQAFVSESLYASRKEIEAARMASRSGNAELRAMATMLETEHKELNERLEGFGGGVRPFAPPSTASGGQHTNPGPSEEAPMIKPDKVSDTDLARLDTLTGDDFDREWVRMMIDGHEKSVTRFSNAAEGGGAEAQAIADDYLPIIRRHLSALESLQKKLP